MIAYATLTGPHSDRGKKRTGENRNAPAWVVIINTGYVHAGNVYRPTSCSPARNLPSHSPFTRSIHQNQAIQGFHLFLLRQAQGFYPMPAVSGIFFIAVIAIARPMQAG